MTDEQINVAIAEACGWTEIHDSGPWHNHKLWGYPPERPGQCGNAYKHVLDYCNDLNAMHEAEKWLGCAVNAYGIKLMHLIQVTNNDCPSTFIWHATARQRAEAFLRTLGKWEEVQA